MNFPVCLCKSALLHLHTATPSNVNRGHVDHMHLYLLDKTLVLTNSFGGSFDTIVYRTSRGRSSNRMIGLPFLRIASPQAWSVLVSWLVRLFVISKPYY
uniref:Uncharacterized protein n=1 Tax=Arundo donax TaxID=35708 RepID=A0A0A9FAM6_ARUDO